MDQAKQNNNLDGDGRTVLVVEDSRSLQRLCKVFLDKHNYRVVQAMCGDEALDLIEREHPDIAIVDLGLPDRKGLDLLSEIRVLNEDLQVIIMTAQSTLDNAVAAMRLGACDFITKPVDFTNMERSLAIANRTRSLKSENRLLRQQSGVPEAMGTIIGQSRVMSSVKKIITKIGPTDETVLVTGENGTGKEVVARAIHAVSLRSSGPFIAVNCGAIAENLIESELFGHVKGAFSGANTSRTGYFRQAEGGTLFLDEIGEMTPAMQVKLLRALENREVTPVGADRPLTVDIRVVAATNVDLLAAIKKGEFREDLFYRINIFQIEVPPLRERTDDIPLLARHILNGLSGGGKALSIDPKAMEYLEAWPWNGNVRELSNVMRRAAVLAEDRITVEELPSRLIEESPLSSQHIVSALREDPKPEVVTEAPTFDSNDMSDDLTPAIGLPSVSADGDEPLRSSSTIRLPVMSLEDLESKAIEQALQTHHGDRARTAAALGIDRTTLYRKLKRRDSERTRRAISEVQTEQIKKGS